MPLPKRTVEPVHISRGTLPEEMNFPSELEAVTNGCLANAVRQLSSLSKHAEDLFAELTRDSKGIAARANSLQARLDRLALKVTQLDSTVEEVSLQEIHMRKAFKSSVVFDQQVVSRDTMPTAMMETYNLCDKPPPLDKLNAYREDGKDGLKFYTDPDYFFDLWRQEMLKDTERMMHDRCKRPHKVRAEGGRQKKRVRQPHNTRERQRQIAVGHGEYIMPQTTIGTLQYRSSIDHAHMQIYGTMDRVDNEELRPSRPNSIELKRSYPSKVIYSPTQQHHNQYQASHYQRGLGLSQEDSGIGRYDDEQGSIGNGSEAAYTSPRRPTQPPPAPPAVTNTSTNSTPTLSSGVNTPTRGSRSVSLGREALDRKSVV